MRAAGRPPDSGAFRRETSAAVVATVVSIGAAAQVGKPALPRQPPAYYAGWVCLPARAGEGTTNGLTVSALPTSIGKKGSEIAKPGDAAELLGYDPTDVRRAFSLENTTFLLGEPLLVKFGIALEGGGKWRRDDWLYHNNRDETFIIVMRGKDGRWVPDRYAPKAVYHLGGVGEFETFDRNTPEIHWLLVQQYCAITNVGEYELFCMKWDTRCKRQEHYPVSPLRAKIPPDLIAEISTHPIVDVDSITDYARFNVSVVSGDDETRARMVRFWTDIALSGNAYVKSSHRGKPNATFRAWEHSLQSDFLPYLKPWWKGSKESERKSPFAWYRISSELNRWEPTPMTRSQAADVIPKLIEQLDDGNSCVRSAAEFHLREWTGKAVGRGREGHKSDRPTPEEGRTMQAQWRQWRKQTEKDFREDAQQRGPASK